MGMILICLCVVCALFAGCGDDSDDGRVRVVATTTIAADIVRNVAGPDADVEALIPESASPHDYALSAKDRARLEDADLVVAWGAGLEENLALDELDDEPLELAVGQTDPHVWMDPGLAQAELPELATELAAVDPDNRSAYRNRADAYIRKLVRLDRELAQLLAEIPPERRKLVTSHDSLGHFVRRYDFDFVGAPFGITPGAEPSADKVASLIERVKEADVPAVFAEDTDDPALMRQIADEAGVEVVDALLTEGFGGRVDSYEDMLRYDARLIADALTR
jgi:zinc/manganese transport system substrate-binding protein